MWVKTLPAAWANTSCAEPLNHADPSARGGVMVEFPGGARRLNLLDLGAFLYYGWYNL
jgi:hypothetical protein